MTSKLGTLGWMPDWAGRPIKRFVRAQAGLLHVVHVWLAILRRLALKRTTFVAVTGSVGKTTTTHLIGAVLATEHSCRATIVRNGLRTAVRAVLSLDRSTKFSVHEVGTKGPGTIAPIMRVVRPHIGVITTIGNDHYRQFRGLEATSREKAKVIEGLPCDGVAILNADDPYVRSMANYTRARVVTYGISSCADIRATDITSAWPERLSLTVHFQGHSVRVQTQLLGKLWVPSVLAAMACGVVCNIDPYSCASAVEAEAPVFARYSVHQSPGSPVYVLDTRKAAYWTLGPMLEFVQQARAPRKTIIIGTISDHPGGVTGKRYRKLAREALAVADRVIFVGSQSIYVDKLRDEQTVQRLFSFSTSYEVCAFLARTQICAELILVKASLVDHLERVMLSNLDTVVCWREKCRRQTNCCDCSLYKEVFPSSLATA